MKSCMQHWNGHQLCVIDTETTGYNPSFHEIAQIAVVALDSNLEPRRDVTPFNVFMRLEYPERAEKDALRVSKLDLVKLQNEGFDRLKTIDMLEHWRDSLGLSCTAYGLPKKIMILGHNLTFDIAFIKNWMGDLAYEDMFDYHIQDTMQIGMYLNNRAAMHSEVVPFSKLKLGWMAKKLSIDASGAHNALTDCIITAKIYKELCAQGLLG